VGYCPVAPGTCGSVLGLGLVRVLASLPLWVYGLVLAGVVLLGLWASGEAEQLLNQKDASCIVVDEIAGMLVACVAITLSFLPLLAGFALFRLFDIVKPLPRLETLPGGWGVMLDDLFAGLLAQGGVRILLLAT
jgi:phosphatidylglycerophosphatase A